MTGLPTGTLKVDDGSGTYPTDLSSRVEKQDGVTISGYGRTDEQPAAQAATLSLTLDNADGALTTGGTALSPGQKIRYIETIGATTDNRFTGRISELMLGWMGGIGGSATVQITAADFLADLGRVELRSMLEEEILLDNPTAYYTLGEAEGATSAGDTSGNQVVSLSLTNDGGTPITFGQGTGPGVDGLTAAQFAYNGTDDSQYLSATTASGFISGGSWSVEFFAASTLAPFSSIGIQMRNSAGTLVLFSWDASNGVLSAFPSSTFATVSDTATHHFAMTFNGTARAVYMDGTLLSSGGASLSTALTRLSVGSPTGSGTISHVAVYDGIVLSAARVAAHAALGLRTFSEDTAARFDRIAGYAGFPTVSTPSNSGMVMGSQATSGSTAYDALNAVAAAEGGVMFADGSGLLTMQGRSYRAAKITADQTIDAGDLGPDTALTMDTALIINKASVTRTGAAEQVAINATSDSTYGSYSTSLDLAVDSDATALNLAQWIVAKHSDPSPRIGSLTLRLHESAVAETTFAREIGDRIALSGMPSQEWTVAGDVVIEGWTETLTEGSWILTANVLPWSLFQAALYNNAAYKYDVAPAVYGY